MINKLLAGTALAASLLLIPGTASAATPTSTTTAAYLSDRGSPDYQNGYIAGYDQAHSQGIEAAHRQCKLESRGFEDQHAAAQANDYDTGFADGAAKGYPAGFDWGYKRFCGGGGNGGDGGGRGEGRGHGHGHGGHGHN